MHPGPHRTLLGFCVLEYVWGRRAGWKLVLEQMKGLGAVQLKKNRFKEHVSCLKISTGLSEGREIRSVSPSRAELGPMEEAIGRQLSAPHWQDLYNRLSVYDRKPGPMSVVSDSPSVPRAQVGRIPKCLHNIQSYFPQKYVGASQVIMCSNLPLLHSNLCREGPAPI